jgi:hypothetical protein
VKWRYILDGDAARTYIEHVEFPRFRAEFVDDTDCRAEVLLEREAVSNGSLRGFLP